MLIITGISTIKELKGIDLSNDKNPLEGVKRELQPSYREYVMSLMKVMGLSKFEKYTIRFSDFIDWYKKNKN